MLARRESAYANLSEESGRTFLTSCALPWRPVTRIPSYFNRGSVKPGIISNTDTAPYDSRVQRFSPRLAR